MSNISIQKSPYQLPVRQDFELKKPQVEETKQKEEELPAANSADVVAKRLVDEIVASREIAKSLRVNDDQKMKESQAIDKYISSTNLKFDMSGGQVVVKVTDVEGEVIRQMPPEVSLKIAEALKRTAKELATDALEKKYAESGVDYRKVFNEIRSGLEEPTAKGSIIDERA